MADRLDTPLTSVVPVPHGYRVYGATHTWSGGDPLWIYLGYRLFRRSANRLARRWLRDEHVDRAVSAALDRAAATIRGADKQRGAAGEGQAP